MVFCDPDEQFWQREKETDLMECALKSKRKGFKTVSTDDSFREYFKGSREMGTACSSIYVNYTSRGKRPFISQPTLSLILFRFSLHLAVSYLLKTHIQ